MSIFRIIYLISALLFSSFAVADSAANSNELSIAVEVKSIKYNSVEEIFDNWGNNMACNLFGQSGCSAWVANATTTDIQSQIEKMSDAQFRQYTQFTGKPKEGLTKALIVVGAVIVIIIGLPYLLISLCFYGYAQMKGEGNSKYQIALAISTLVLSLAVAGDLKYAADKGKSTTIMQYFALYMIGTAYQFSDSMNEQQNTNQRIYVKPIKTARSNFAEGEMRDFVDFINCAKSKGATSIDLTLNDEDDFFFSGQKIYKGCLATFTFGNNKEISRIAEKYNLSSKGIEANIKSAAINAINSITIQADKEINSIQERFLSGDNAARNSAYIDYMNLPKRLSETYTKALADYTNSTGLMSRQKNICNDVAGFGGRQFMRINDFTDKNGLLIECVKENSGKSIIEYIAAAYLEYSAIPLNRYKKLGIFSAPFVIFKTDLKVSENYRTTLDNFSFKFNILADNISDLDEKTSSSAFVVSNALNKSSNFDFSDFEKLLDNYENEYNKSLQNANNITPVLSMFVGDSGFLGTTEFRECSNIWNRYLVTKNGYTCGSLTDAFSNLGDSLVSFGVESAAALGSSKLTQIYTAKRLKAGSEQSMTKQLVLKAGAALGVQTALKAIQKESPGSAFGEVDRDKFYSNEAYALMIAQVVLKPEVFDSFIGSFLKTIVLFGVLMKFAPVLLFLFVIYAILKKFTATYVNVGFINTFAVNNFHLNQNYNNVAVQRMLSFIARWAVIFYAAYLGIYLIRTVLFVAIQIFIQQDDIANHLSPRAQTGVYDITSFIDTFFIYGVYIFFCWKLTIQYFSEALKIDDRLDNLGTGLKYEDVESKEADRLNAAIKGK